MLKISLQTFLLLEIVIFESNALCNDYVTMLAPNDIFLNYRKVFAMELIRNGTTVQKFVHDLDQLTKGGETYSCGYTRFWIDNLFVGSARQYEELRRSKLGKGYGLEAGFYDLVGDKKISKLFQSYSDLLNNYVLYKFQIDGVADHVWAVLQMPGPKYKIYQSYNMAYSLYAWLAKDMSGLFRQSPPGHIRYWDDVYTSLKQYLEAYGGQVFPNGTIGYPSTFSDNMKKWAQFVIGYNQDQIETNFKLAWTKFGQNKWIESDVFMRDYVDVLQTLVDIMKSLVGTSTPWNDDLAMKWISLFASPNPLQYPGVPFNTLTQQFEQKLELQVKVEIINVDSNNCKTNYLTLSKNVPKSKAAKNQDPGFMLMSFLLASFVTSGRTQN